MRCEAVRVRPGARQTPALPLPPVPSPTPPQGTRQNSQPPSARAWRRLRSVRTTQVHSQTQAPIRRSDGKEPTRNLLCQKVFPKSDPKARVGRCRTSLAPTYLGMRRWQCCFREGCDLAAVLIPWVVWLRVADSARGLHACLLHCRGREGQDSLGTRLGPGWGCTDFKSRRVSSCTVQGGSF